MLRATPDMDTEDCEYVNGQLVEVLSTIREVRFEISRLNRAARETVFNPAITQLVEQAIQTLEDK